MILTQDNSTYICLSCFYDFESLEDSITHQATDPLCNRPNIRYGAVYNHNPNEAILVLYDLLRSPSHTIYSVPYSSLELLRQYDPVQPQTPEATVMELITIQDEPHLVDYMTDTSTSDTGISLFTQYHVWYPILRVKDSFMNTVFLKNDVLSPKLLKDYPLLYGLFCSVYFVSLLLLFVSSVLCLLYAFARNTDDMDRYYIVSKDLAIHFVI
ncbi:hypothetical protein BD560DRAFT_429220 [Blakeslea trispora]|nr:hypothetical protein BD560DRAFT_429220 [Blakeslea trispora]